MKNFFLIALPIIIADQISKFLLTEISFGILNYTQNTGAGFGLFQGTAKILIFISIFVAGYILYYHSKNPKENTIALSLIFAGTIGNMIDRIFLGFVRDFIDLGFFPVFNIADLAISIGASMLILYPMYAKSRKKHSKDTDHRKSKY